MKQIVQVYKAAHQWRKSPPGLGDFIRGTCHLHERLAGTGIDLKIDIDQSGLSQFIKPNAAFFTQERESDVRRAREYFKRFEHRKLADRLNAFTQSKAHKFMLCTNLGDWQRTELPQQTKDFVKPLYDFSDDLEAKLASYIGSDAYEVLSIRCGDQFFKDAGSDLTMSQYLQLEKILETEILPRLQHPLVISSDHFRLKEIFAQKFKCKILPHQSKHGAFTLKEAKKLKWPFNLWTRKSETIDLEPLALDLCMLKNSKFNYHINLSGWWSGFSHYTSIIFSIPTLNIRAPHFHPELVLPRGHRGMDEEATLRNPGRIPEQNEDGYLPD